MVAEVLAGPAVALEQYGAYTPVAGKAVVPAGQTGGAVEMLQEEKLVVPSCNHP